MTRPIKRRALTRKASISGLEGLKHLKRTLEKEQSLRLAREAEAREQAARADIERNLFSHTVGVVLPLRRRTPVTIQREPVPAVARQRERDEAAVLHEAISDEFDVESLLETDDELSFRRSEIGTEVVRKLRRGFWAIQAELDLHGLRRDEARNALAAFLRLSLRRGMRCVRVVHGKGNGSPGREPVLKGKVKSWLVQRQEVIAFVQARADEGGHGALVVLLSPAASRNKQVGAIGTG